MKEQEIRPQAIFEEYLRLAALDTKLYFENSLRQSIPCPACNHAGEVGFSKKGFTYQVCPECDTIFVSPRPSVDAFERYYTESKSSKYWATTFYKETAAARKEKLWKPKAKAIMEIMQTYGATHHEVVDIGAGYGLFAEEMTHLLGRPVSVIEPAPHLAAVCREKGLCVHECFMESLPPSCLPEKNRVFVCFELFEHLHSPKRFLARLFELMQSGDLFVFTTLSGSGVDIQALWQDSKSIFPPHHLNFFNPSSVKILLKEQGFDVMAVSTPGKLDMDILINNQAHIKDRFWKLFVKYADPDQISDMQRVISETGFSSHMMVVSCKP